jgi:osmotically-inducible protein OsmY
MKMKESIGFAWQGYEKTDGDLAMDIQEAIGRDVSLSLVADNIHVRVENEIVTLEGEVVRQEERITAGDIATARAGYDKVNNYLGVMLNEKPKNIDGFRRL